MTRPPARFAARSYAEALLGTRTATRQKVVFMSQLLAKAVLYAHVVSLALSVGGLFGYLLIVWLLQV